MRITQWGEYGVLFSAYIARCAANGAKMVGAAEIASAQGVDLQYAQQILQRLRRGGIIDSVRGPAGGYHLCRNANELTLLDILVAAEGDTFEVICDTKPIGAERCMPGNECGLRTIWFDLRDHVNSFLMRYTLEDLAKLPNGTFCGAQEHDDAPIKIGGRSL
ncbi:MAG: Rrf2 family transcriptional regulator [Bdellovibrionota bacterium]